MRIAHHTNETWPAATIESKIPSLFFGQLRTTFTNPVRENSKKDFFSILGQPMGTIIEVPIIEDTLYI